MRSFVWGTSSMMSKFDKRVATRGVPVRAVANMDNLRPPSFGHAFHSTISCQHNHLQFFPLNSLITTKDLISAPHPYFCGVVLTSATLRLMSWLRSESTQYIRVNATPVKSVHDSAEKELGKLSGTPNSMFYHIYSDGKFCARQFSQCLKADGRSQCCAPKSRGL